MSVYMIIEIKEIMNQEKYGEYVKKVPEIVAKFGGRYLVRGGSALSVSGNWNPLRLIVIEFDSMEKFKNWWNSSEYRVVAPLRESSAKTNAIIVEGIK